jgi:hypothetical protein
MKILNILCTLVCSNSKLNTTSHKAGLKSLDCGTHVSKIMSIKHFPGSSSTAVGGYFRKNIAQYGVISTHVVECTFIKLVSIASLW